MSEKSVDQAVEQPPRRHRAGTDDRSERAEFAKFGALIYLTAGLGYVVTQFLALSLADDESLTVIGLADLGLGGEELFISVTAGYETVIVLAPIVAVGLGLYYHVGNETTEPTHVPTTIAAAAGTAAISLVLLVLMVLFEPDGLDVSIGSELPGVIGIVVGTVATAGAIGYLLDNYR